MSIRSMLLLCLLLLWLLPAHAKNCSAEVCMNDVTNSTTKLIASWSTQNDDPDRTHFNVIWQGGGGRIQAEVPASFRSHTLEHFKKATVYTISVQGCSRSAFGSTCGGWAVWRVVSCGTRALPCRNDATSLPRPMNIESGAGMCLDVHAPDQLVNGAKVQVWECNGSDQQVWVELDGSRAIFSLAGKCLDVHAPDQRVNGAKVQVWDCNRSAQQTWSTRDGKIRSAARKCLDVHAPDQERNGAKVQVWDCNETKQQRWRFVPK